MFQLIRRIVNSSKKQVSGSYSTNVQAENITINSGVTYTEAKEIASAVYRDNFTKLAAEASAKALEAIECFNIRYVDALREIGALERLKEPSIQMLLVQAQKSTIAANAKLYEDCILNMLIERTKADSRGVLEIAQEEAITVLSKVTDNQLNILSMAYLLGSCSFFFENEARVYKFLAEYASGFSFVYSFQQLDLKHLEHLGCIKQESEANIKRFGQLMSDIYPGLYAEGFSKEEFLDAFPEPGFDKLIALVEETGLYRPIAKSYSVLLAKAMEIEPGLDQKKKLLLDSFLRKGIESWKADKVVEDFYVSKFPESSFLFGYSGYFLTGLTLSPTGMAIARANFKNKTEWSLPWLISS